MDFPRFDDELFNRQIGVSSTGCWLWAGHTNSGGYGVYTPPGGKQVRAHRYAYELRHGEIPEGMTIDHVCHGPDCMQGYLCLHRRCVNPDHLAVVTLSENSACHRRAGAHLKDGNSGWYSIPEVAEQLRMGKSTVYKLVKTGQIESHRFAPKAIRIHRDTIAAYVERSKMPA